MELKCKGVKAEYINSRKNYVILKVMGSPTLVYGEEGSRKKMHNGVAFKDTATARQVAADLLAFCDVFDVLNVKEKKKDAVQ